MNEARLDNAFWCLKEAISAAHEAAGELETEEQFPLVRRLDEAIADLQEIAALIPEDKE